MHTIKSSKHIKNKDIVAAKPKRLVQLLIKKLFEAIAANVESHDDCQMKKN